MENIEQRLRILQICLPMAPAPGGLYMPVKQFGVNLAYTSGAGCNIQGEKQFFGKVGKEISLEEAQKAAYQSALNLLAVLEKNLGTLDRIKRVVKILGFVASEDSFTQQPEVLNSASQLFCDVFGEDAGKAARSAIGVNVLPGNIPVEIELLVELWGE